MSKASRVKKEQKRSGSEETDDNEDMITTEELKYLNMQKKQEKLRIR